MAAAAAKTFRTGTKQIYLPDHIITLCRPHRPQPPQFATFKVPLNFNKLDIRDYLLHAYNVASVNVRSHIAQRPPRVSPFTKRTGRPPPIKYMTVELEKPFVFPREPNEAEKEKWHNEEMRKRIKLEKDMDKTKVLFQLKGELSSPAKTKKTDDRVMLAEQARDLLSGKTKWENKRTLDPRWTEQEKK